MRTDYTGFTNRLRAARASLSLSQRAVSALIHKSESYYQQIENGNRVPSLSVLIDLCYALNISPNGLLIDSLPEHVFGELPQLPNIELPLPRSPLRNTLTNWLNVDAPDECLCEDETAAPVNLRELPPIGFVNLVDDMP